MGALTTKFKNIKEKQARLRKEVIEKTVGYILAAFGLVAGLAWNEAIKALIENSFPLDRNGVVIKFIYAVLATVIIVTATIIFVKKESQDISK